MAATLVILLLAVPLAAGGSYSEFEIPKWLTASLGAAVAVYFLLRGQPASDKKRVTGLVLAGAALLVLGSFLVAHLHDFAWTDTLHETVRMLVPVLLALAAANAGLGDRQRLAVILAGAFAPALALGAEVFLHANPSATSIPHDGIAFTATFGNTAHFGEFAVLALPFIGLLIATHRKGLALAAFLPTLWIIYRADSRAAWIGAVAAMVVWGLAGLAVRDRRTSEPRKGLMTGVAACVILGALVVTSMVQSFETGPDVVARAATVGDPSHDTNRIRLGLWESSRQMVMERPLFGVGAGNFALEHPRHRLLQEWELSGVHSTAEDPHSEPMRWLVELGVVGTLILFVGIALLAYALVRNLASPDASHASDARCALAGLAAVLLISMVWATFHHPATAVSFAILMGLAFDRRAQSAVPGGLGPPISIGLVGAAGAALLLCALWAERDSAAVSLRDEAEGLKRKIVAMQRDGRGFPTPEIAALGDASDGMLRVCASPVVGFRMRHRLLLTLTNLGSQRAAILASAEAFEPADDEQRKRKVALLNAARRLPEPREIRAALEVARERAPTHFPTLRMLSSHHRAEGRIVVAQTVLEEALALNEDAPLLRVMLAEIFGDEGLYHRATGLLEEELTRYADSPHADSAWEVLARTLGAQGKLLEGIGRVQQWIERHGESDRRWAVAGELSLRFGETPETVGLFSAYADEIDRRAERSAWVSASLDGLEADQMRTRLLSHLGQHPHDVGVLDRLRDTTQELLGTVRGQAGDILRRERKRVIARSRVLYAWEHFLAGDDPSMRKCFRIARRMNPGQGDAYFLELLPLVKQKRFDEAVDVLRRWREEGFRDFPALERNGVFEAFLDRDEVRSLLENG